AEVPGACLKCWGTPTILAVRVLNKRLSRAQDVALQSVRSGSSREGSAVVGGSAERAEGMPSGRQPIESDPAEGTSAGVGSVDTRPAGTARSRKALVETLLTGADPENRQPVGRKPPESPEIRPDTRAEAIDAVEGLLFRSLLGRGLIVSLIPHHIYQLVQ